jgi:hypothetical protein
LNDRISLVVGAEHRWGSVPKGTTYGAAAKFRLSGSEFANRLVGHAAETAVAIAASYASYVAKAFRIKTGTQCAMPGASALNVTA